MKIIAILIALILPFTFFAKEGRARISSRVIFQKGVSQKDIAGWESDFFKDQFPVEETEESSDTEFPDKEAVKAAKLSRSGSPVKPQKKKIKTDQSENNDVEEVVENIQETAPETIYEKVPEPQKKPSASKSDPPLTEMEVEKIEETPDEVENEVDRSDRIRKMKELLKKRKGKNRVEDRRVY